MKEFSILIRIFQENAIGTGKVVASPNKIEELKRVPLAQKDNIANFFRDIDMRK